LKINKLKTIHWRIALYFYTSYRYEKENNETRIACRSSRHNMYQLRAAARCSKTTATTTCACNAVIKVKSL
jgi:hypothetical protein